MYIWKLKEWPRFKFDISRISQSLNTVYHERGRLLGRMEGLGFSLQKDANLKIITKEVVKTSEIEGEILNERAVRSSIGKRLGMNVGGLPPSDRFIDGIVNVILDATSNYMKPLTGERLCTWHSSLFPTGHSGFTSIVTGAWRPSSKDPMQVVSGPVGSKKIHFEAPPAHSLDTEIDRFLNWFNTETAEDALIKAGIAHLWFVTIHPFEDGNGRIGRAIMELALTRSEGSAFRFFSLSNQIRKERKDYYAILKAAQSGNMDITNYLDWYLGCLLRSIESSREILANILNRARFWERFATEDLNERQIEMLNRLLEGFEGKLTSSKWAKIVQSSQDTAHRDIKDLVARGILFQSPEGGRSTSYSLVES